MISAVVLSHNDEKTIAVTLASIAWCDEVIVIDDASVDASVSIAKKSGAQVLERKLEGDFASQRNFGLAKANGDWMLFVDSDEIVSAELKDEIVKAIATTTASGFKLKREDVLFGTLMKYGETADVRLLRLAKKNAGEWKRAVHEVWEVSGRVDTLIHPLRHTPHGTIFEFLAEINLYSTLNAKYMYLQNIQEPAWYIVAYPMAKFLRNYLWLRGYKDGTAGAILAIMMSFHSFLTRSKLYLLWHKQTVPKTL